MQLYSVTLFKREGVGSTFKAGVNVVGNHKTHFRLQTCSLIGQYLLQKDTQFDSDFVLCYVVFGLIGSAESHSLDS